MKEEHIYNVLYIQVIKDFLIGGEPNNLGYRRRGTNERSEYKSAEFRTPESESEHNPTNYFIIFLLLFY